VKSRIATAGSQLWPVHDNRFSPRADKGWKCAHDRSGCIPRVDCRPTTHVVSSHALITAASELFARHGYDHVSLDEVAERAGVTKVIVYRYFASKKDLYLQLLAAHRDRLLRMAASGPLRERVPAVADA